MTKHVDEILSDEQSIEAIRYADMGTTAPLDGPSGDWDEQFLQGLRSQGLVLARNVGIEGRDD